MNYELIILSVLTIIAIYQHFRINYVRDKWTELLKEKTEVNITLSESDNKTILFLLDGYYDRLSERLEKRFGNDYFINLKRWCVEQAMKNPAKDTMTLAENIEGYILKKESPQNRYYKMKDKKPDLSKIKTVIDGNE
jgi:hypothetical protein